MSFSITQEPEEIVASQSPIVFTVYETDTAITTTGSFQYVNELYYWTGSSTNSGSEAQYTLVKYPNQNSRGIFDVSKVLNSLFIQPVEENPSQTFYFAVDAYYQWRDGNNTLKTGSHVMSDTYTVVDSYALWGEPINQALYNKTDFWPILSSNVATQSYTDNNFIDFQVWTSGSTSLRFTPTGGATTFESITGSNDLTNEKIQTIRYTPPNDNGFYVTAINVLTPVSERIYFDYKCPTKYDNIRIKWKNRFGAFDFFNFDLVSREQFKVTRQKYQPQLGNWNSTQFSYNDYDSQIQNYLTDTEETIRVNTDYVSQDYNATFKELMVSDEIYWIYDESNNDIRPISIDTSTLTIKTNVVNKLIQYAFDFTYGQPYKLQM